MVNAIASTGPGKTWTHDHYLSEFVELTVATGGQAAVKDGGARRSRDVPGWSRC